MGITTSFYELENVKTMKKAIAWIQRDREKRPKAVAEVDVDKAAEDIAELLEDASEEAAEAYSNDGKEDEDGEGEAFGDLVLYTPKVVKAIAAALPSIEEAAQLGPSEYVFAHFKGFHHLFSEAAKRGNSVLRWTS